MVDQITVTGSVVSLEFLLNCGEFSEGGRNESDDAATEEIP